MEKEKLLKQAKFLYPVGTEFKNLPETKLSGNRTVTDIKNLVLIPAHVPGRLFFESLGPGHPEGGCCYYKGKWAEVIARPDEYIKLTGNNCCCTTHLKGSQFDKFNSRDIFEVNKTYKVIDRIVNGSQFLLVISNGSQVYIVDTLECYSEYSSTSTKEQFDKDWNEVEFKTDNIIDFDNFPKEGCCDYNEGLREYLEQGLYKELKYTHPTNKKLLVWNEEGFNICITSSRTKYKLTHAPKQKPMEKKEDLVVHVPYIEMYNFVKDNSKIDFDNYNDYEEETCLETCLMVNAKQYSSKHYYESNNYKVTPFKDWLKQTNNETKWKEYLFELAKKRYPIGCTITDIYGDSLVFTGKNAPGLPAVAPRFFLSNKNSKSILIYTSEGKWAEFTEPEVKSVKMDYKKGERNGVKEMTKLYASTMLNAQYFSGLLPNFSHVSLPVTYPFPVEELITRKNKLTKREYYIPKQEVEEVKKVVEYVPRERNKSINKY